MSFPSLLALLLAGGRLRRRRPLPRWLPALALLLAGLLGSGIAQATVYNFSGNPVDTCTLSGTVYTCPYPAYLAWDDSIVIGNGYTLKVTNDVTVTYSQGLTMGSNAKLIVTGNLDLTGINPANLKVSGGQIEVGGTFSMGALPQSITGNVTAGAIQLGTDKVTITGKLVSTGVVSISSGSRITGDVSGTVITTSSPVTITGNVTATSKFTLASGSSVTGAVTAPVFDMLASSSRVTGNIVASTAMTMGSGNTVTGNISTGTFDMQDSGSKVTGDIVATSSAAIGSGGSVTGNVDTGDLLLRSSSAVITGNAKVNWATLQWAGRVTGTIYCKNGTARNRCDCVTNNSGYGVNRPNGPTCESAPATRLHHFQITHDGSGDTCVPEPVTVTACANGACTAYYTKGVSGQLSPFGAAFAIAAGQSSVQVSATQIGTGTYTLDVTSPSVAPQAGEVCYNTSARSGSCAMAFAGGVKLLIDVPHHQAGTDNIKAAISAVKANDQANKCVPVFANASYNVTYACSYAKPSTGSEKVALGGANLACGTPQALKTDFVNGVASLALKYPDAGEVGLSGTLVDGKGATITGSTRFVTAPARFALAPAAAPLRAGADFDVEVKALNVAGIITKNFDTGRLNAAAGVQHGVVLDIDCRAQGGALGLFTAGAVSFANGSATVKANWTEVGKIDLKASLTDFLGTALDAGGSTNTAATGCKGNVGRFIPQYFRVELAETGIQAGRGFYYSGEPFTLKVSAMSKQNTITENYEGTLSELVTLAANATTGTAFAPAPGTLNGTAVAAKSFANGLATVTPNYAFSAVTKPTRIRLRALDASGVTSNYGGAAEAAETDAMPEIRSGRLRIANAFGGRGSKLSLPVMAEYWTGNSWMLNTDDNYTAIPYEAFAIFSTRQPSSAAAAVPFKVGTVGTTGKLVLVKGARALEVTEASGGAGWGDVTVNLGADAGAVSCLANIPASKPVSMQWLRFPNACPNAPAGQPVDPSARATFGVFAPETKRVIHVREVFR